MYLAPDFDWAVIFVESADSAIRRRVINYLCGLMSSVIHILYCYPDANPDFVRAEINTRNKWKSTQFLIDQRVRDGMNTLQHVGRI